MRNIRLWHIVAYTTILIQCINFLAVMIVIERDPVASIMAAIALILAFILFYIHVYPLYYIDSSNNKFGGN